MSHVADGDLHAYLDEALETYAPAEAERIRGHLESCAECALRLEEESAVREGAGRILGAVDLGSIPLASLAELEARAGATGGSSDPTPKATPTWRKPSIIGMGWAATIALALWTGYSVKDVATTPVGRPPAVLAPADASNASEALVADEQPPEENREAAEFDDSQVESEAQKPLSVEGATRGAASGAGVLGEGFARADQGTVNQIQDELRAEAPAPAPTERAARRRERDAAAPQSADVVSKMANLEATAIEARAVGGTVVEAETGLPLSGVRVVLTGTDRSSVTDQDGRFVVPGVPVGSYEVTATILGFSTQAKEITVGEDRLAVADFELPSSVFSLEGVTVTAGRRAAQTRALATSTAPVTAEEAQRTGVAGLDADLLAPPIGEGSASYRVPNLEMLRNDVIVLPGMGTAGFVVQTLESGGVLELWSLSDSEMAVASPSTAPDERITKITAHFSESLPAGWSMAVRERVGGYLVARARLPQEELDALLERAQDGG